MKTSRELLMEVEQVEQRGREFGAAVRRRVGLAAADPVLFRYSESRFSSRDDDGVHVHHRRRWIEAARVDGALEYRLLQDEADTTDAGHLVGKLGPVLLLRSDSAIDVVEEGDALGEEERLADLLAPWMDRAEAGEFLATVEPEVVAELEAIVEAGDLLPAARLCAKADIVELLEGHLEPGEFITAAIARHRHTKAEMIAECVGERLAIDPP